MRAFDQMNARLRQSIAEIPTKRIDAVATRAKLVGRGIVPLWDDRRNLRSVCEQALVVPVVRAK